MNRNLFSQWLSWLHLVKPINLSEEDVITLDLHYNTSKKKGFLSNGSLK